MVLAPGRQCGAQGNVVPRAVWAVWCPGPCGAQGNVVPKAVWAVWCPGQCGAQGNVVPRAVWAVWCPGRQCSAQLLLVLELCKAARWLGCALALAVSAASARPFLGVRYRRLRPSAPFACYVLYGSHQTRFPSRQSTRAPSKRRPGTN